MSAPNANDPDASESGLVTIPPGLSETSEVDDPEVRARRSALATRIVDSPTQTAMLERFSWALRLIARFLFAHVLFEKRAIDNLHDADRRGNGTTSSASSPDGHRACTTRRAAAPSAPDCS